MSETRKDLGGTLMDPKRIAEILTEHRACCDVHVEAGVAICKLGAETWPCETYQLATLATEATRLREFKDFVGCGHGCECNEGDGEEWCVGTCIARAEATRLREAGQELLAASFGIADPNGPLMAAKIRMAEDLATGQGG